jgi:hypothetical protein
MKVNRTHTLSLGVVRCCIEMGCCWKQSSLILKLDVIVKSGFWPGTPEKATVYENGLLQNY